MQLPVSPNCEPRCEPGESKTANFCCDTVSNVICSPNWLKFLEFWRPCWRLLFLADGRSLSWITAEMTTRLTWQRRRWRTRAWGSRAGSRGGRWPRSPPGETCTRGGTRTGTQILNYSCTCLRCPGVEGLSSILLVYNPDIRSTLIGWNCGPYIQTTMYT